MAIAGEANPIFRPVTMFDRGIDGEVEFKNNDGKASGKRIYIQLKSGNSYLRTRKGDGSEVFDVKDDRHLTYRIGQPVDVYLVIRQTDELTGQHVIRWMNVTRYLKACLKTRPVRAPGLQMTGFSAQTCRLRALTRRFPGVFNHALKDRTDKRSRQINFDGAKLDREAVWKVRDAFFPPLRERARKE